MATLPPAPVLMVDMCDIPTLTSPVFFKACM